MYRNLFRGIQVKEGKCLCYTFQVFFPSMRTLYNFIFMKHFLSSFSHVKSLKKKKQKCMISLMRHCKGTHFRWIYQASLKDLWPFKSHCDAVGEDEGQNNIVKQLMGDDRLAYLSEPDGRQQEVEL